MRNQKEEFFELIYAQYAKKLERICLRYVNYQPEYREIAADSVQKTFLKALEEYDKLKDASYIEPWLYQTCMHRFTTALKTYRRRMKHHVLIDEKWRMFFRPSGQLQRLMLYWIKRAILSY